MMGEERSLESKRMRPSEENEKPQLGILPDAVVNNSATTAAATDSTQESVAIVPDTNTNNQPANHLAGVSAEEAERMLQNFYGMLRQDAETQTIISNATADTNEEPLSLETLEHFRIISMIGQGGMGTVYLAEDTRLGRRVAIKTLRPRYLKQATAKTRFLAEARMAAQLHHDHIIPIYHVGEVDGIPFLAMPLLSGSPLDETLGEINQLLPLAEILRIGREIALGLGHAHAQGLTHRDIKPANIWLEAPTQRVKILDFGLAKSDREQLNISSAGLIVGTPAYMSPEQARGNKADGRSDLFSLGVMLYEMTTGRKPFHGADTLAVLSSLAVDVPPRVNTLNPLIPERLATLIADLLEKEPARRPATAEKVATELLAIRETLTDPAGSLVPMPRPTDAGRQNDQSTQQIRKHATQLTPVHQQPQRRWWRIIASLLVIIALIAGVIVIIKDKNGKEIARVEVPNDVRVEVVNSTKAPEKEIKDPERLAAEYVLSIGGTVYLDDDDVEITVPADLPMKPFHITSVFLIENKQLANSKLSVFSDCKSLRYVNLYKTATSNTGLANFKQSKGLQTLLLTLTQVNDAGLEPFKDFPELEEIHLSYTLITNRALAYFKNCPKLFSIHVSSTDITDEGLEIFKDHQGFTHLDVSYTKVSDRSVKLITRWKKLVDLDITECQITEAGYRQIKQALPNCKIRWKAKAE